MATNQIPVALTPTPEAIPASLAPILKGDKGDKGDPGDVGSGGGATNLAYIASPTGGVVTSDTGTDAAIPLADGTNAGLMTPAEKTKLSNTSGTNTGDQDLSGYSPTSHNHSGVYDPAGTAATAVAAHTSATDPHGDRAFATSAASTAQANAISTASSDATTKANAAQAAAIAASTPAAHAGSGGTAHANAVAAGAAGFMSGSDKSKLDGIAAGAQVNPVSTDAVTEGSTNLYHAAARVRATVLTGLSTALGTVVTAAHTVLEAIGFLQKQVSDNTTGITDAKVRSVTIMLPATNDEVTLFRARAAMNITKLVAVGGGFTYTVRKAADRSATGTEVVTGGSTVTSTTTGDSVTSFNSASIAAGDYVWLKLTSVTGTPASFNLTMEF